MSYNFPYQGRNQTMMISSPTKLQHSVLTSYPDCGPNAYKNLLMYSNWQWPPTPECVAPSIRLPHINRYNAGLPSIPSPLTPATPSTHRALCTVEPMSPALCPVPASVLSPNPSPSIGISMPGVTPFSQASPLASTPSGSKRGRPRADVISSLQYFGSNSTCTIRCHICHRVFPREKSLQAHLRTHTGERPYRCDYPNCTKSFVQSGQLKTHQRLHSGEKPFKCSDEECNVRFTHANRHCPDHPHAKLLRDDRGAMEGLLVGTPRQDTAIADWLDKYVRTRLDRTTSMQRPNVKRESTETYPSSDEDSNTTKSESVTPLTTFPATSQNKQDLSVVKTPLSAVSRGTSAKRQLLSDENDNSSGRNDDNDEPAVRIPLSPKRMNQNGQVMKIDPRHPVKKRILAYNQQLMKENQDQLKSSSATALPLLIQSPYPILPPVTATSPKRNVPSESEKRMSVSTSSPIRSLLNFEPDYKITPPKKYSFLQDLASLGNTSVQKKESIGDSERNSPTRLKSSDEFDQRENMSPVRNTLPGTAGCDPSDRWNGALALMQLASSPPSRKISSSSFDSV